MYDDAVDPRSEHGMVNFRISIITNEIDLFSPYLRKIP